MDSLSRIPSLHAKDPCHSDFISQESRLDSPLAVIGVTSPQDRILCDYFPRVRKVT